MPRSIHTPEVEILARLLRKQRERARLNQAEVAERLGRTQSWLSKVEDGEIQLDVIQLRRLCAALGITLAAFVRKLERELDGL